MNVIVKLILLVLAISATGLQARQVSDLYSASVTVESRNKADYKTAVTNALVQVLAKSSGSPKQRIQNSSLLATDLNQADKWVEQFSYVTEPSEDKKSSLTLKVTFPEHYITGLLKRGQLPFWPASRPQAMLLVLESSEGKVMLVNNDPRVQALTHKLDNVFGLVTIAPNQRTMKKLDLRRAWSLDDLEIQLDTEGQAKDAVFVVRLKKHPFETVEADWLLLEGNMQKSGSTMSGSTMSGSLEDSLQQAYQWLSGQWSKQYALPLMTDNNEFVLSISNVESFDDYMGVMNYLKGLGLVRSVFVLGSANSSINVAISLNTEREKFNELLIRSDRLVPDNNLTDAQQVNHFWWRGKSGALLNQ